jgi:TPR repeat protein
MYAYGKGVSQTNKEAAKWFQLATKQNNKLAQGELDMLPSKYGSMRED